ncbi:PGPGW domain-containing protein [Actinomadura oligospora]|uniref:PGPGW domain-containing protein n=1 Tax=Actinomadura oligospora TaxID=111804 RepID=UPI0004B6C9AC|nr:PGPGW domain-containing protein [Actinomadura oligospora]
MERFQARVRRNRATHLAWRGGVLVVGTAVLAVGVVMMVTPGPGILGIVLGLAILATEFVWAQSALHRARVAADKAKEKALAKARGKRSRRAAAEED